MNRQFKPTRIRRFFKGSRGSLGTAGRSGEVEERDRDAEEGGGDGAQLLRGAGSAAGPLALGPRPSGPRRPFLSLPLLPLPLSTRCFSLPSPPLPSQKLCILTLLMSNILPLKGRAGLQACVKVVLQHLSLCMKRRVVKIEFLSLRCFAVG